MEHLGTKQLSTPRLILRRFSADDAAAMYNNWACDPDVTKFLTWPPHDNVNQTREVLLEWTANYQNSDYYNWAIAPRETGNKPVGSISVVHIDDAVKVANVGYCIGKPWWNNGITTEALRAVIHFLFTEVGANRIEALHDISNPASGRVMRKNGLRYEGTLRESARNNQGIRDMAIYSILKKEHNDK